jgi:hypothetical protein
MKIRIPPAHRIKKFVQGELAMFLLEKTFWPRSVGRLAQVLKTTRYDPSNMYRIYRVHDENDGM